MKRRVLEIIAFISGAAVMSFELVGSRVLSPYLGNSIVVWTSVIGTVLAGLSGGYWFGGRLSDKRTDFRTLGLLVLLGGIAVFTVVLISPILLKATFQIENVYLSAFIASLSIFLIPSFLLGAVYPYAMRLSIEKVETSGHRVGSIAAVSTIGSLVGTFATGFYLVSHFGTNKLLLLISLTLILTSFLALGRRGVFSISAMVIMLGTSWWALNYTSHLYTANGQTDFDTQYGRFTIKTYEEEGGRLVRALVGSRILWHSWMYLDDSQTAYSPYVRYYRLADHFVPERKSVLLIGGGGYSAAKDFLSRNDKGVIDVVEIDSQLTEVAKKYFALPESPRLRIFAEDGRRFLARTQDSYDVILIDAFSNSFSVPHHLTTKEFLESVSEKLNGGGVILSNTLSPLKEGGNTDFLKSIYATYNSVFEHVLALRVKTGNNEAKDFYNVMIVGSHTPLNTAVTSGGFEEFFSYIFPEEQLAGGIVFTDDFAPAEQYLMRAL
jgi:spermidine synthase